MTLSRDDLISRDLSVPPTPPPLPNFARRRSENQAKRTAEQYQYPRNVKLILPPQPGETSTDEHLDVAEAKRQWGHGNRRRVKMEEDLDLRHLIIMFSF